MSLRADVVSLLDDSGSLVSVSGLPVEGRRFVAISLEFVNGALTLRCNDDTDEILTEVKVDAAAYPPVSHDLLVGLIGMTTTDGWIMTNDRGFTDAFQIRFLAPDRREETRQFEVAASAIAEQQAEEESERRRARTKLRPAPTVGQERLLR